MVGATCKQSFKPLPVLTKSLCIKLPNGTNLFSYEVAFWGWKIFLQEQPLQSLPTSNGTGWKIVQPILCSHVEKMKMLWPICDTDNQSIRKWKIFSYEVEWLFEAESISPRTNSSSLLTSNGTGWKIVQPILCSHVEKIKMLWASCDLQTDLEFSW